MDAITLVGIIALIYAAYHIGYENGQKALQRKIRDHFCIQEEE